MPKKYLHHYSVSGRGPFPVDMLRYDRSMPASESDAGKITESFGFHREQQQVELIHYDERADWTPCKPRWKSFAWSAESVSGTEKV